MLLRSILVCWIKVELLLYQVDEYASALRSGRPYRSYVFDYR